MELSWKFVRLVAPRNFARFVIFGTAVFLVLVRSSYAEKASSADAFVGSVGINVHLHHTDTGYSNFAQVEKALKELHVRHVRDGLVDTTWKDYYNRHNELGRAGIKGLFITSPNQGDKLLLDYPARMKDSFEGYESPNEYDQSGNPNWSSTLSGFLTKLIHTVKSDPQAAKFPIVGPSLTQASSFAKIGVCGFDYSNLHDYFAGRNPGTGGWGSNGYGSIVWNLANVTTACPSKPVITTETGYQTISSVKNSVPESVAAKYIPRIFLEQWLRGIKRTYLYELLDLPQASTSGDKGFGLLRSDFSPKPGFTALRNLLGLLSEPGSSFTPADFSYQLTGDLSNVHHALFQKSNGSFYLALWVEESSYDVDGKKTISVRPRQIVIQTAHETGGVLWTLDASGAMKSKNLENSTTHDLQITDSVSVVMFGSHPNPPTMYDPIVIVK
jgi:hypothetical protein